MAGKSKKRLEVYLTKVAKYNILQSILWHTLRIAAISHNVT